MFFIDIRKFNLLVKDEMSTHMYHSVESSFVIFIQKMDFQGFNVSKINIPEGRKLS